jgi:hypothetical protein
MSSRTNTPIWRTASALTLMFWAGVACAPLAALILLIGDSGGVIKFALIVGMASVVLIGLSVTWRRDASSVERDLALAIADTEADTHRMIAELRAEMRQQERGGEPIRAVGGADDRRGPRPRAEVHAPEADRSSARDSGAYQVSPRDSGAYQASPRRRQTIDHDEVEQADPVQRQPRHSQDETYAPSRRREQPHEDPELTRHVETVSVTHRETTTMRGQEGASRYGGEDDGYTGRSSTNPLSGKLRRSRREETFDPRSEADSLLSGLQAGPGRENDWYREEASDPRVPKQRHDRAEEAEPRTDYGRERGGYERDRREPETDYDVSPRSGRNSAAWRTQERSAELRMGVRDTRHGPEDGWQEDAGQRTGGRHGGGRHYDEEPEPTRAISAQEAEPMPRWRDYDQPEPTRAGTYMDEHYGERRR